MKNQNEITIFSIQGIDKDLFSELNDLGYKTNYQTDGIRAEYRQEILDFIVVSTITFPYQFALSLLEDKLKGLTKKVSKKMFRIWTVLKDTNPCHMESGKDPVYKKPSLNLHYQISEDEYVTIDIKGKISESVFNKLIDSYFRLIKEKTKNRIKEEKLRKKLKLKKRD